MTEVTPFERQLEDELQGMIGPIPRFDAIEIAETAAANRSPNRHWPRASNALGLSMAACLLVLLGIGLLGRMLPTEDDGRLTVSLDGSGDFATVGAAVEATEDGAVIWLAPGVYEETVEVTTDIEIRADGEPGDVVFHVRDAGPAFRLRDADATISGITFISQTPADPSADRRPVIDIRGGSPVIENLVVRADAPEAYRFIRLNATGEGTIIRDNRSSGSIVANQGALARIEGNVLLPIDDPDWPATADREGVGIVLERADVSLSIRGNELNTVAVISGHAEIVDNEIHGTQEPFQAYGAERGTRLRPDHYPSGSGDQRMFVSGECGVMVFGGARPSLIDNRIFDHGTGVCGTVDVRGGEIHDNAVGFFVAAMDPTIPLPASTLSGGIIRDNDIGIQAAPFSEAVLTDVALCGNGVDLDAPSSASIVSSGSGACGVPGSSGPETTASDGAIVSDDAIVVAADGSADHATIGEAVALAERGGVVRVEPGVYEETVAITRDIEIRGQDGVTIHIPSDGPAFELTHADARISDITFISRPREDSEKRRPAIVATGGAPVFERLTAHADEPVSFDFIRLYETGPGTVVRDSVSSGVIRANRGAEALIEGNILIRQQPDAPGAGVTVKRADTLLRVVGNEMNFVDVVFARAEIVGNDIHGARPPVPQSVATSSFKEGACGVSALPGQVSLTSNRIHDNETGICGALQVHGGEFRDNVVGVWASGSNGSEAVEEMTGPLSIRDAVIRGNEVGIRVAPASETSLLSVALCDNGVDIEGEESATVEQLTPAECEA